MPITDHIPNLASSRLNVSLSIPYFIRHVTFPSTVHFFPSSFANVVLPILISDILPHHAYPCISNILYDT